MKALIVYESMYGNTRAVAEAVAEGLSPAYETEVKPVTETTADDVGRADLLVVGAPTHVHGLPRPATRKSAAETAASDDALALEPTAQQTGLREWFEHLDRGAGKRAAAFDTRLSAPPLFTGRASVSIAKHLRKSAFEAVGEPTSFLVDKQNHLLDGELERAQAWGRQLVA
ncbi:MAG: flavodoxin [Catenulispora sp.]|nr:flavodoxin [Catenulispora sp.]